MEELILENVSGPLPTSQYIYIVNEKRVGFLQLRHRLSAGKGVPIHMASHIYYEVKQSERGKGYGSEMLTLGLKEARKLNLKEIFITCDEDNVASKRVIEKNNGVLVEQVAFPEKPIKMLKFKIEL